MYIRDHLTSSLPTYQKTCLLLTNQNSLLCSQVWILLGTYMLLQFVGQRRHHVNWHTIFHGCKQGRVYLGDEYVARTGYGQYVEGLNTIVIFPQVDNSTLNPHGCWDWWGYTSPAYASKLGLQMISVRKMLERVARI